ncbi:2og-fe oxygenase [Stylonychia lemnae]|uniref:2og-fe oxygenase n=1 Tax=Stylonychia lemnae TaxID=5949 RepID=A0A078A1T6_STYLE|nr:2og-fe oxygenase [Stylonychia lemnae]|eukprot:CDW74749.1 2og-fe oxygenase [Stylonychia lemnae]
MITQLFQITLLFAGIVTAFDAEKNALTKAEIDIRESVYEVSDKLDDYLKQMIEDKLDYVVVNDLFGQNFTRCLYEEMKWVDENKKKAFEDGTVISNDGFNGVDYNARISKIFLFKNFKADDFKNIPCAIELSEWTRLLRKSIDKYVPPQFELDYVEGKYIHYFQGGLFVPHYDTIGDPYENAYFGNRNYGTRIMSILLYLNPDLKQSDGGSLEILNEDKEIVDRVVPSLGKTVFLRSNKVLHSSEQIRSEKRSLVLFFNLKHKDQVVQ